MNRNITINWKGKEEKRGLTETAVDTLRRLGYHTPAEELNEKYLKRRGHKEFCFENELSLVKEYVVVRI